MSRRIVTAREQHQMLSPWRTAGTYWHITDNPDFKPDPSFRPENNGTMGGNFSPGLFVSQHPNHWMQSYGYWRPYMSEIDVPDEVGKDFQNSPERFITPDQYDKIKVKRTIPVDAYAREQYGESGWVESAQGEDFETGEKFTDFAPGSRDLYKKTPGYKYPGTAMDQPEEWRKNYEQKVRDYQQRTPGIIARVSARPIRILYHHTSPEAAESIRANGFRNGLEKGSRPDAVFFSTHPDSEYAHAFGAGQVQVHAPEDLFDDDVGQFNGEDAGWLDDEFPSGEQHWAIPAKHIRKEWIK